MLAAAVYCLSAKNTARIPLFHGRLLHAAFMSHLERWMAYFSNQTSQKELEEIAMSDPMIQEALQAEREFLMDPLLLTEYDLEEDERRDRVARENYISQQGRQEGWQQGRQEGWQQGRQQGRQEVALDMLRGKEPLDKIVTYSKLTMEQIKQLGKENGLLGRCHRISYEQRPSFIHLTQFLFPLP